MMSHKYEESSDLRWTEIAAEMIAKGSIVGRFKLTGGIGSAHVWGFCPRCEDRFDVRQTMTAVIPGERTGVINERRQASDAEIYPVQVDVDCRCNIVHPGAPDGVTGCGVSFRVQLPPERT
jgi:hypothetical protein